MDSDRFEKKRNDINFWLSNIDSKVSFALAFVGIMFGFIFSNDSTDTTISFYANEIKQNFSLTLSIINFGIFILSIIFLFLSLIFFFYSLKARYQNKKNKDNDITDKSFLFWGTIADTKSFSEFKNEFNLNNTRDKDKENDFLSQTYINAKITQIKFYYYNKGLLYLMIGTGLFILFKMISYFQ